MGLYDCKDINKTRKDHQCNICFLKIPKGVACFYDKGVYDGEFFSRYSHNECITKLRELNHDAYDGDDWCELYEGLDYIGESYTDWRKMIAEKYGVEIEPN